MPAHKRLLAISWAMPPWIFPRSIQVARAMAAVTDFGWSATVLRADLDGRTGAARDDRLQAQYARAYEDVPVRLPPLSRQFPRFWRRELRRNSDGSEWIDAAVVAAIGRAKPGAFDVLATFGQPWSDHLIGLRLKQRLGLPWLAHFSDPWVDNPFAVAIEPDVMAAWRGQERVVIEQADRVIFTTEEARRLVMGKYPAEWSHRAAVVPHIADVTFEGVAPTPAISRAQPLLIYTGDFYGPRTPVGLLTALAQLRASEGEGNCPRIEFIGRCGQFQERARSLGVGNLVGFLPQMAFTDCLARAQRADALLLIDAPSENSPFLASKLVDYLAIGKPVLGLTPARGSSARLLHEAGCLTVEPNDIEGISAALRNMVSDWRRGGLSMPASFATVAERYSSRSVGASWNEILRDCGRIPAMASRGVGR